MWCGKIKLGNNIAEVCVEDDGASGLKSWSGTGRLIHLGDDSVYDLNGMYDTEIGNVIVQRYNQFNNTFSFLGSGEPKVPLR